MRNLFLLVIFIYSSSLLAGFTEAVQDPDPDLQYDLNYCASAAKNYTLGKLKVKNLTPHNLTAQVFPFSDDIYYVTVSSEIINEAIIEKGPDYAYSCFRCPDLEMVVSQESYAKACATE